MAWNEDWTIDNVEQNYRVLGKAGLDPDDVVQLIEDSKELRKMKRLQRDGVMVSRGEAERLAEWKRQVKENRR